MDFRSLEKNSPLFPVGVSQPFRARCLYSTFPLMSREKDFLSQFCFAARSTPGSFATAVHLVASQGYRSEFLAMLPVALIGEKVRLFKSFFHRFPIRFGVADGKAAIRVERSGRRDKENIDAAFLKDLFRFHDPVNAVENCNKIPLSNHLCPLFQNRRYFYTLLFSFQVVKRFGRGHYVRSTAPVKAWCGLPAPLVHPRTNAWDTVGDGRHCSLGEPQAGVSVRRTGPDRL